ncbi:MULTISPECIES: aminotransferase class V-fold PLP-dependent enzyme [unclassified Polynucleobacter]|jgi:aspartate aminotransferase-like enzyme|uniref:aminotransferase class V-fold PLP-dependent enzyme n=1 Tax=unclassified Polynucleobacter TaxID=2640945 RepID=UPI001C0D6A0D|nr:MULTISPECIES: aminotransferase class V-fold PLP-dependent enzyme [unclassified Polynucleobacter]MBU3605090.1 alanine--glyoxylate aminotransferase family protein [Polynucleobacter sp. AP-Kaivos-20-H2]MBU3619784.1 alanine--glyoxylate aminotransferase family protein [Polynucleobacter sp. JS-Fieb-80-E5]
MPGLLPNVDPDGLLEFSVVYTDRSLNHMSEEFKRVMVDISSVLKDAYNASSAVIVPGSGTFGMEAVARQFANNEKCLVLRNGWFSYRWTQIFDLANITKDVTVIKGHQLEDSTQGVFAPAPIEEVVAFIKKEKPAVVFAPHVETSAGIILPDDYLKAVGEAVRSVNGLFVLDCIASGAMWVDMKACNVDVLITAPQKGWSSSPCCALIALGDRARERIDTTQSSSFSMDLKKWLQIMEAYEKGGHVYHTTMPTDALKILRNVMKETQSLGFAALKEKQIELGTKVRNLLVSQGYSSVSAKGFQAPGVVVSYTKDPDIQSGKKFIALGMQTAAGVPLQCDERADFRTFRLGLFGLEKLANVDRTVGQLATALEKITETEAQPA